MLFNKQKIPPEQLIALKFKDSDTFRQGARIAVERDIPVDAPGHDTLIIKKADKRFFKSLTQQFEEGRVADPEKIPSEELSKLRRQRFQTQQ